MARRILACGDRALLVEVADTAAVVALSDALRRAPPAGVVDVVPAARTVLVTVDSPARLERLRHQLGDLDADPSARWGSADAPPAEVTVAVIYDGDDLADVAAATGLTVGGVVAAHTGTSWRVGFCGFAPGFAYLVGGDPRLAVPRRSQPRSRVPAGSVALAGEFSGVYPRPSPGGWNLIGRTDATVWDLRREPPALLTPGVRVQFRDVTR